MFVVVNYFCMYDTDEDEDIENNDDVNNNNAIYLLTNSQYKLLHIGRWFLKSPWTCGEYTGLQDIRPNYI